MRGWERWERMEEGGGVWGRGDGRRGWRGRRHHGFQWNESESDVMTWKKLFHSSSFLLWQTILPLLLLPLSLPLLVTNHKQFFLLPFSLLSQTILQAKTSEWDHQIPKRKRKRKTRKDTRSTCFLIKSAENLDFNHRTSLFLPTPTVGFPSFLRCVFFMGCVVAVSVVCVCWCELFVVWCECVVCCFVWVCCLLFCVHFVWVCCLLLWVWCESFVLLLMLLWVWCESVVCCKCGVSPCLVCCVCCCACGVSVWVCECEWMSVLFVVCVAVNIRCPLLWVCVVGGGCLLLWVCSGCVLTFELVGAVCCFVWSCCCECVWLCIDFLNYWLLNYWLLNYWLLNWWGVCCFVWLLLLCVALCDRYCCEYSDALCDRVTVSVLWLCLDFWILDFELLTFELVGAVWCFVWSHCCEYSVALCDCVAVSVLWLCIDFWMIDFELLTLNHWLLTVCCFV